MAGVRERREPLILLASIPQGLPWAGARGSLRQQQPPQPGSGAGPAAAPTWLHPKKHPSESRKQPHPCTPNPPPGRASCAPADGGSSLGRGPCPGPGVIGTSLSFSSPNLVHFVFQGWDNHLALNLSRFGACLTFKPFVGDDFRATFSIFNKAEQIRLFLNPPALSFPLVLTTKRVRVSPPPPISCTLK